LLEFEGLLLFLELEFPEVLLELELLEEGSKDGLEEPEGLS